MRECRLGAQVGGSRKYGCSVSFCFLVWVGNGHFVEVFFVFCLFFCLFFFLGGGCRVFASESTVRALSLASI